VFDLKNPIIWQHVYDVRRLRESYYALKRRAAPGVDGQTWQAYGEELEGNLEDLSGRLKRGAYRAKPVRRAYIPKADGRQRPLGVSALEDKIVQRATVEVLQAIYEVDFVGFSYGFRPGRSQHDALDALSVGLLRRKVNWVLDADVRGFFDAVDHAWQVKFVEHRIADRRVVRHIKKWLKAGVLEDGQRTPMEEGTPQGGSISPLLGNIYLHYVFDLWVPLWRRKQARGDVIVVRYADDIIRTVRSRLRAKLQAVKAELRRRLHDPVSEVGKWLASVVRGHVQYYGVPWNSRAVSLFRHEAIRHWFRALRRRSQNPRVNWERMSRWLERLIPPVRVVHPFPEQRLIVTT
jgi:group II intron reverse transcriptase/maturase